MNLNPPNQSGPPRLRIDIEDTNHSDAPFRVELTTPSSNRPTDAHPRLPALQIPSFGENPSPSPSYLVSGVSAPVASKALNESRKLLAHLLGQLQGRPLPPPVFDAFKDIGGSSNDTRFVEVVETVKAAVRIKGGKRDARGQPPTTQWDDSDEEDETEKKFTTDATFSLMTQLKDVLLISRLQNWHIFYDRYACPDDRRMNTHNFECMIVALPSEGLKIVINPSQNLHFVSAETACR